MGLSFDHLRGYAERKGWSVVPVLDEDLSETTFTYQGSTYVVYSDNERVRQITKDDEEISWAQVPEALKGLL